MKVQVTQKYIRQWYDYIFQISYCGIQNLMWGINADYYNSGVYGWNCDYYIINSITIWCTGYRPHGIYNKKTIEIFNKYDKMAKVILDDNTIEYNKKRDYIASLRDMCNDELMETIKKKRG